jgi:hypothetical protein
VGEWFGKPSEWVSERVGSKLTCVKDVEAVVASHQSAHVGPKVACWVLPDEELSAGICCAPVGGEANGLPR